MKTGSLSEKVYGAIRAGDLPREMDPGYYDMCFELENVLWNWDASVVILRTLLGKSIKIQLYLCRIDTAIVTYSFKNPQTHLGSI